MTHKQPSVPANPVVALLIDGENCSPDLVAAALAEAEKYGPVPVRRVYANWTVGSQRWLEPVALHKIRLIHHEPAVQGKNAIDIALVVDAMDLLHTGVISCFCLVASDSDYTPLVKRLCAAGRTVVVLGRAKTPQALVDACSRFVVLEQPGVQTEPPASVAVAGAWPSASLQTGSNGASAVVAQPAAARNITPNHQTKTLASQSAPVQQSHIPSTKQAGAPAAQGKKLRALLTNAWHLAPKQNDWLFMGALGHYLKQIDSTFSPQAYGYSRLGLLLEAHTDLFKLRQRSNNQYDVQLIGPDKR